QFAHTLLLSRRFLVSANRNGNGPLRCSVRCPVVRRSLRKYIDARFLARLLPVGLEVTPPEPASLRVLPRFHPVFAQTIARIPIREPGVAINRGDNLTPGFETLVRNNAQVVLGVQ